MNIVEAHIRDMAEILELQKLCYHGNAVRYDDFNIPPLTQTQIEIEEEYAFSTVLKVESNRKIVASVRSFQKNNTCYIGKLIVHPEYQNKGLGTKLMIEIENKFNTKRFELFTGTRDDKNLYLYKKLGYKIFKEEQLSNKVSLVYLEKVFNTLLLKQLNNRST